MSHWRKFILTPRRDRKAASAGHVSLRLLGALSAVTLGHLLIFSTLELFPKNAAYCLRLGVTAIYAYALGAMTLQVFRDPIGRLFGQNILGDRCSKTPKSGNRDE